VDRVLSGPPAADPPGSPGPGASGSDPRPARARIGTWVAGCGSLPPGLPADFYARVGRAARERGARFVPDCDGAALAAAVEVADMLVPNDQEAERLTGHPVDGPAAAVAAGRALLERGPERVVITLGERGAVAVDGTGAWSARTAPPAALTRRIDAGSAVGAGDALLAAFLEALDEGDSTAAALAHAVAAGTAVLLSGGSDLVASEDAAEMATWVRVEAMTTDP
jgi:fructose-1-phosphate kinase PfkB-like protein